MGYIKRCPVKTSLSYVGKKWTLEIVRDMFFGKTRFKDFLEENPNLTSKVLSQRLRELEAGQFVEKIIMSKTPLRIEYQLTEKGYNLNKIMYELAMLSFKHHPDEVFEEGVTATPEQMVDYTNQLFKIQE
ncbi:MAG: winged helix-turn-helix transcriptional regulator [Candidatus Hodarchaeales archaeon]|jgi:DNA-binding HxlR family transcriptional regulator